MLTDERHDAIRQQLAQTGKVLAVDLAQQFGVSEDTIRRDLRELARQGVCRRVYGGALLPATDQGTLATRSTAFAAQKSQLAEVAATLVQDGQIVFIDAGSTNLAIAHALPRTLALTVVTNAPAIATALSDHPSATIIMLGGLYEKSKGACLGPQTVHEVQQIYADLFILGTCAVDASIGVTALDPAEAEVKRAMLAQSNTLLIAASPEKLGTIAPFKIADVAAIDHLIVDADTPSLHLAQFEAADVQVHRLPG